jgi:hypothetical protein
MGCACGGLGETTNAYRILVGNCLSKSVLKVRFQVFTAVTMKNAVFWDVSPCRLV